MKAVERTGIATSRAGTASGISVSKAPGSSVTLQEEQEQLQVREYSSRKTGTALSRTGTVPVLCRTSTAKDGTRI